MSSIATTHRQVAAVLRSETLLGGAAAAATLAGSVALLAQGGITHSRSGWGELNPISVALATCATVPLIAWRRFPLGVFVTTALASVLMAGLGYPADPMLGPTVALYLLAVSRERESAWTCRTSATVVVLLVAYLGATAVALGIFPRVPLEHSVLGWAVAWFAGERTRLRREQIAELKERSERIQRDARRERQLAAAEERARIARDLHDSAGHAISVIAVRAGAARLRHQQDPARSLLALEAIEELARNTAEEIDQIVRALRWGGPTNELVDPPTGLATLDTLISRQTAAGLKVTLETVGARRPLGRAADQAAYRILQEALTNAARHGAGSARIELAFGDAALELTVTNPVVGDREPRSTGGHGLIGMRERATLLGGSLDARRANGGFRIRARVPYGARGT